MPIYKISSTGDLDFLDQYFVHIAFFVCVSSLRAAHAVPNYKPI